MFTQEHKDGHCFPNQAGYCNCPLKESDSDPELVCSDVGEGMHMPVIDIDFPIQAVPSATPGHFHLYINKEVEWDKYCDVIMAMCKAGLVQWQWFDTMRDRGFSAVRHPDKPKNGSEHLDPRQNVRQG